MKFFGTSFQATAERQVRRVPKIAENSLGNKMS